jgi:ABC-type nitrate/sulfonate/bicarbonate transport system substrate-binding protein
VAEGAQRRSRPPTRTSPEVSPACAGLSSISQVTQLKGRTVSVNAPNDIGTLLIESLLTSHGLTPKQVRFATNVPFPAVVQTLTG